MRAAPVSFDYSFGLETVPYQGFPSQPQAPEHVNLTGNRAAALFQSLLRIPALAHSNEIFARSVAFGFLNLCGLTAKVSTDAAGDLVEQALTGTVDVRQIAATLKSWTS